MKTPLPNQLELATLAAAFPSVHDPAAKVDAALDVWKAAAHRLQALADRETHIATHRQKYDAEWQAVMDGIEFPPGSVSLEVFLSKTMPRKDKADRMKCFRDFLKLPNPAMPRGEGELSDIRMHGFSEDCVEGFAFVFRRWLASHTSKERKATAKDKSKTALLKQYGSKWVRDALGGQSSQTHEILIENTIKANKRPKLNRTTAAERVDALISNGLIVKNKSGKSYIVKK